VFHTLDGACGEPDLSRIVKFSRLISAAGHWADTTVSLERSGYGRAEPIFTTVPLASCPAEVAHADRLIGDAHNTAIGFPASSVLQRRWPMPPIPRR